MTYCKRSYRLHLPALACAAVMLTSAQFIHAEGNSGATAEELRADYPITKVGIAALKFDYNRITQQGVTLTVRIPGIYADVANTPQAIVNTNVTDGQAQQAKGFLTSLSRTNQARNLNVNDQVFVTKMDVRNDEVRFELITANITTLGDGTGTRYRAELNIRIPGLSSMPAADAKKIIDGVIADKATAADADTKTIKIGMSTDEVKKSLGSPDKIVDLGEKQIYIYKDMRVVFKDAQVADVQ